MSAFPLISVVVLNYNGCQHLETCFRSLQRLDYPRERLELILVDNASTDGSVEFVTRRFPEVRVIGNRSNVGFAKGNNIGAEAAQGEYVAFLNNDTWVDPAWARELVQPVLRDESVVCTASKIVDWNGKVVDFVEGVMNFYGHGHQKDFGRANIGEDSERPILFACGGSMLINREIFLESGGFDEDYFIYFEDVDLGWRLWLMGYQVRLVPTAITYHRQHATMDRFIDYRKTVLYERNALYTIIKNYDQETLSKVLPVAFLLAAKRMKEYMEMDGVDFTAYHITGPRSSTDDTESVSRVSLAPLVALNEVIDNLPTLMQKRERVQRHRRRSDAEIFTLFGQPFRPIPPVTERYIADQYMLANEFGIIRLFERLRRRVLVISPEPMTDGNQGLRDEKGWLRELCRALECRGHEALLAFPNSARSEWSVPSWQSEPLMHLVHRISPDIVVACGAEALIRLAGCPFPLVFYSPSSDHAGQIPAEHLSDLTLKGPLEEIIEPLDRFCRAPMLKRELSAPHREEVPQKSFRELLAEAWYHYRRGGIRTLAKETWGFFHRRLRG